jgi:hypothetical protein
MMARTSSRTMTMIAMTMLPVMVDVLEVEVEVEVERVWTRVGGDGLVVGYASVVVISLCVSLVASSSKSWRLLGEVWQRPSSSSSSRSSIEVGVDKMECD